jgi:hypothetical protein
MEVLMMLSIRLTMLSLLAALTMSSVVADTASAHEFRSVGKAYTGVVEGSGKEALLESKIAKETIFIRCEASVFAGTLEANGRSTATVDFEVCSLLNGKKEALKACKIKEPIAAKVKDELTGPVKEEKLEDEFSPEVGEDFVTITIQACAVAGKYEVKGSQTCKLPEAEKERELHTIECARAGSKLKLGKESASFETKEEKVRVKELKDWSAN